MAGLAWQPRSSRNSAVTSVRSCSRRRYPARSASPRLRVTGFPQSPTTVVLPEPRPTGRWRWSLSSVPKERRGLGRGLEVLLGEAGQPELLHLPVETIHPNPRQPRRRFEPEAAAGLAASIRLQGGLKQMGVRRRTEGGFELVAGERRWRAACAAGTPTLPAIVKDVGDRDSLLLSLVE